MEDKHQQDTAPAIRLNNITKTFDGRMVLDHICLNLEHESRTILMGPSGAGKSTLMRIVAGLLAPDEGEVDSSCHKTSMVFDRDRLYPTLTCLENICLGLPYKRKRKAELEKKARETAQLFQCDSFLNQKANTLSAGQRQRAALARAFMKDPDLLLLDESFNSLDTDLKYELIQRILQLQKEKGFILLVITHSQQEAMWLKGKICLVENGQIKVERKSVCKDRKNKEKDP